MTLRERQIEFIGTLESRLRGLAGTKKTWKVKVEDKAALTALVADEIKLHRQGFISYLTPKAVLASLMGVTEGNVMGLVKQVIPNEDLEYRATVLNLQGRSQGLLRQGSVLGSIGIRARWIRSRGFLIQDRIAPLRARGFSSNDIGYFAGLTPRQINNCRPNRESYPNPAKLKSPHGGFVKQATTPESQQNVRFIRLLYTNGFYGEDLTIWKELLSWASKAETRSPLDLLRLEAYYRAKLSQATGQTTAYQRYCMLGNLDNRLWFEQQLKLDELSFRGFVRDVVSKP